jgi:hypothetical protein
VSDVFARGWQPLHHSSHVLCLTTTFAALLARRGCRYLCGLQLEEFEYLLQYLMPALTEEFPRSTVSPPPHSELASSSCVRPRLHLDVRLFLYVTIYSRVGEAGL